MEAVSKSETRFGNDARLVRRGSRTALRAQRAAPLRKNLSGGHFETHAMPLTVAASGGQGFNFDYSGSGENNRGCF